MSMSNKQLVNSRIQNQDKSFDRDEVRNEFPELFKDQRVFQDQLKFTHRKRWRESIELLKAVKKEITRSLKGNILR